MSSASMAVRFPDGDIRWGIYNGTSDIAQPWLYPTPEEAWGARRSNKRTWDESPVGEQFDVDVFSWYGPGFWWKGLSTKELYLGPFGDPDDMDPIHMIVELGSCRGPAFADAPDWVRPLLADTE